MFSDENHFEIEKVGEEEMKDDIVLIEINVEKFEVKRKTVAGSGGGN